MRREALDVLSECAEQLGYLTPLEPGALPAQPAFEVVVAVDYAGACRGTIYLGLGPGLARQLAVNMLGCPGRSEIAVETACEAAQEMVNVIAGNVLPLVHGSEPEFRIGAPRRAAYPDCPFLSRAVLLTEEGLLALLVVGEAATAEPAAGGR